MNRSDSPAGAPVGLSDEHGPGANGSGSPGSPRGRLPYEKPGFRTLHLAAEEVLAVGCKLAGGPGGPIGATCTAASCFAEGS